ncbi:hypothetical protein HWV62_6104 [Athelia sp. TMB]|nr:hypothetical protein HWV62_6104 [Athelia sp. TMB]
MVYRTHHDTPIQFHRSPPLPAHGPPGFGWEESSISTASSSAACITRIKQRDAFLGQKRCVVCGIAGAPLVQQCFIIPKAEPYTWEDLKDRGWIPPNARYSPHHDPRGGLLLCANHARLFERYGFFIRFRPDVSPPPPSPSLAGACSRGPDPPIRVGEPHGRPPLRAVPRQGRRARRGRQARAARGALRHPRDARPFAPPAPEMPDACAWQDWIGAEGVWDEGAGSFRREGPPGNIYSGPAQAEVLLQIPHMAPDGSHALALDQDAVANILAATRASASWRACVREGTSWAGTAEENVRKYVSAVGIEDDPVNGGAGAAA